MSKLKYILACLIVVLIILSLNGCTIGAESKKINLTDKNILTINKNTDKSIFLSAAKIKNLKKISSSGMLEMYLDEKTLAVCILDTISGKMWRSLPENASAEKSANLIARIIIKGKEYTLNSQSDSLALGCAEYEISDNGLILYYSFRHSIDNGKKIDLTIPVYLKLTEGNLSVKVDCNEIIDNSTTKIYLKDLSILPYFGADSQGQKDDFILLPSASGIILDTYKQTGSFDEISLPVYGEDIAKDCAVTNYVPIGVFGMKSGNSAFICLIDKGESLATIKAQKAVKNTFSNHVGAEFEITSTKADEEALYISNNAYDGLLNLSYRFLSGNNADYITMAGACRELLIRQGRLTDGNTADSKGYPFNLTLIANNDERDISTSEEEITELLSSITSKGIANVNVLLKNYGSLDVTRLSDFTSKNSLSLSVYENLFSYSGKTSLTLKGEKNLFGINSDKLDKNAELIIRSMRKSSVGVCISDCGNILPSDYSRLNLTSRNKMLSALSSIFTTLSTHGTLTVSSPNIYTVKYADNIINIPLKSPLEDNPHCTAIPFLQAVLHGICDYSFTAVNLSDNPTTAMLKAIEYGCVPHYEWYFEQYEENDPLYYMNSLSQARLLYENMKSLLGDLRNQRITSHEQVKKNVACTIYSGGSEIYVNYNNHAVSVNGITIDPMGFLRVN